MSEFAQQYLGTLLAFAASFLFTLANIIGQSCVRQGLGPGQFVFGRMVIALAIVSACIYFRCPSEIAQLDPRSDSRSLNAHALETTFPTTLMQRDPSRAARLIWLRSVLISLGLCLGFASLARLDVAEYCTVYSPKGVLVGFLCWRILGEAFGWRLRIAAILSTLAVVLVVQPPFLIGLTPDGAIGTGSRTAGFGLCIASLLLDALGMLLLRVVGPGPDPLIMTFAYVFACVFISSGFSVLTGEKISGELKSGIYVELGLTAILGLSAQVCIVMAMQRDTGATVAMVLYSQVPMAALMQSSMLGEVPNMLSIVGMVIIVGSGVWAISAESQESKRGTIDTEVAEEQFLILGSEAGDETEIRVAVIV